MVQTAWQHRVFLGTLFASMKRNGNGRPDVFDAAFLMTRYRSEYAMLELPVLIRQVLIPILFVVGRALGKYKKYETPRNRSHAPESTQADFPDRFFRDAVRTRRRERLRHRADVWS